MQFSTVATIAAIASVASATSNITTATATQQSTTLVTITSCEEHKCVETVSPALVSTATVTINDVVTKYTTWCPISSTVAANSTVPATSKVSAATSKAKTTTSIAVATEDEETTVTQIKTLGSTSSAAAAPEIVSQYTGAAARVVPAAGAFVAAALLL